MSNIILCQGEYAKTPYYLEDDCKNIYCIEELCYYLYHNAYLLDDDFVDHRLADWVNEALDLKELGREINKICKKADALKKLVLLLAQNIGFYTEEEWNKLIEDISENNELTSQERRKIRADSLLKAGKYGPAMDEYEKMIKETGAGDVRLRAKVLHNLGVCCARLFMYERAAYYFERAYDTYANTESYISMLCAMKLYMPPSDYLSFLSSHKESYEDSLEVERRFEDLKDDFKSAPVSRYLEELSDRKNQGGDFYDGIESLTEEVKTEYRSQVFRGKIGGY